MLAVRLISFLKKKKHTCFDEGALKQYNQFLERNPLLFTKFSPRISTRNYFLRACTQYRKSMFYANDVVFHVKFTDLSSHFFTCLPYHCYADFLTSIAVVLLFYLTKHINIPIIMF